MSITPLRLRHAASLAEHASFRRAAATLRISQPALTKNIQSLEAALGVQLFERRRDAVVPTEFGKLVLEHTRGMVLAESELLRQIQLMAGLETGSVKVALGPYPSVMSGYSAGGNLLARHPKLDISLHVTNWREITRLVSERKVDLGVGELTDAVSDDSFQTELVGQHTARFFCRPGHPILERPGVTLMDLLAFPWATTRLPRRLAAAFPRHVRPAGYIDSFNGDFVPAMEIDVPMQFGGLSSRSDVIALGAFQIVANELDAGVLAVIPTPKLNIRTGYGFIYLKDRPLSPAMRAFMAELRDEEKRCATRELEFERRYIVAKRQEK
jgi:DNA-binding transcriptional LysR family regulator